MEWLEISVTSDNEGAEAVAEVLARYAYRGVVIEAGPDGWNAGPVVVRAYLPADDKLRANKRRIEEALCHLDRIRSVSMPSFRPIAEEDWVEAWKERLNVLRIGRHVVIRPPWRDYVPEPGDIVIQLEPGMAFGTGLHPTTQMCLAALEGLMRPEAAVLDVGTGSGILAIAAAKLGAGHVVAVDRDPVAVRTARGNLVANGVQEIVSVVEGSLEKVAGNYDLVVVNILAKVIVEMMYEGLATRLGAAGRLITAGIIADQESDVVAALEWGGLTAIERQQREDWVCLVAGRATTP
ncbi:MAG: 50S ribosomal protein L11 methyltransferase [Anaerolineae bacterium]|nr:50S ribosomal protein L11 methyltransferase [Anaerolineae bacterium]